MSEKIHSPNFDVLGIGNAIVDVLSHANDTFLIEAGLDKGAMTLIDEARADQLYDAMGPGIEASGGSAANTIAGLASMGANCTYIGKVRDDQLGKIFAHDMTAIGVQFKTKAATNGAATARCLIFITPDAQRTMQTYLGACIALGPDDIDPDQVADAKITYMEGYLWDPKQAKEAFVKAAMAAHQAKRKVALSLSDPFCVERHRDSFLDLVNHHVDFLFANEDEIMSLYQVSSFDQALQHVRGHCDVAVLTRGTKGSVVISGSEIHIIDAEPVAKVVDTTGAGDAFAAGFLFGHVKSAINGGGMGNWGLADCARLGGIAAAEVISHMGPRAETSLDQLIVEKGFALS